MNSIWGNNLELCVFGESHGVGIGCVLNGLPSGVALNLNEIQESLNKRSAKSYDLATPRKEEDNFKILSGFFEGKTTGTPLTLFIKNQNTKSQDYKKDLLRASHADYTARIRYNNSQDYRGGGHFSGRLTAPIVAAGSICKQIIKSKFPGIKFGSRILKIGNIKDKEIKDWKEYLNLNLSNDLIPLLTPNLKEEIISQIDKARKENNSIGGIIEGWICDLPAGLGNPIFEGIESQLSSLLFSIPAIKGVEFGLGFDFANHYGSEVLDEFQVINNKIETITNFNAGINGGISNGMPIVFKCVIKPTPSIGIEQKTIDLKENKNTSFKIIGRHDPCIALRAPIIIESVCEIAILDILLGSTLNWNQ